MKDPAPGTRQAAPVPSGTPPFPADEKVGAPGRSGTGHTGPPAEALTEALVEALTEVARSGISPALTQQVERLFAEGPPERAALVDACVGYRDQLAERHPRLAGALLDGLNLAGVREIAADGQRFDPRLHEAFGTEPAGRPELHDTVAETVRRGYADGGRVIRVPQVVVYRHIAPEPGTER